MIAEVSSRGGVRTAPDADLKRRRVVQSGRAACDTRLNAMASRPSIPILGVV